MRPHVGCLAITLPHLSVERMAHTPADLANGSPTVGDDVLIAGSPLDLAPWVPTVAFGRVYAEGNTREAINAR